jgi:hypothetical protein
VPCTWIYTGAWEALIVADERVGVV